MEHAVDQTNIVSRIFFLCESVGRYAIRTFDGTLNTFISQELEAVSNLTLEKPFHKVWRPQHWNAILKLKRQWQTS